MSSPLAAEIRKIAIFNIPSAYLEGVLRIIAETCFNLSEISVDCEKIEELKGVVDAFNGRIKRNKEKFGKNCRGLNECLFVFKKIGED